MGLSFLAPRPLAPIDLATLGRSGTVSHEIWPAFEQRALSGVMKNKPGESRPSPRCALMRRTVASVKRWASDVVRLRSLGYGAAKIAGNPAETAIQCQEQG